jgi:glutaredoxin
MGFEILSKIDCKYCDYAEELCKSLNLDYTRTYVTKDVLKERCGSESLHVPSGVREQCAHR